MSGICGIIYPDGRKVEASEIEAILGPLKRRGPDRDQLVVNAHVGFGHTLLATTPEALIETLPMRDDVSGCLITADARLDNREDLISRLDLGQHGAGIGDGGLILRAYLQWGRECLDHLRGDFAFAIWDPRDGSLLCARDQVGMRQFIWHHQPGRIFAFATEARALLRQPNVPMQFDEGRIGDYLEDLEAQDSASTFYAGLSRLPPAHALIFDQQGLRQWRYWKLAPPTLLKLRDDAAYDAAFLEVFTQAVRTRLRSAGPVGSMLSGGMDSGSVTAIAANLLKQAGAPPLKTFSALREDLSCVESNTIRAALAIDHIDPALIRLEDLEAYRSDLMRHTREAEEPFDWSMTLPRAMYLAAHRAGIKVMLDGGGGDTTLASEPMGAWHLRRGRWLAAWREAKGEQRFWKLERNPFPAQLREAVRHVLPDWWRQWRNARYRAQQLQRAALASPLTADFAERINMPARRANNLAHIAFPADPQEQAVKRILHPYTLVGRERYDRTAAALAIEPRDPFMDLRVIEFCLSLPQEQLQRDGWPKLILRRALQDKLPDEVRWRRGKEHVGWMFTKALWNNIEVTANSEQIERIRAYVSADALPVSPVVGSSDFDFVNLLKMGYLSLWVGRGLTR